MQKRTILRSVFAGALICICGLGIAQPPRGQMGMSRQVNPDKTVTFRFTAPNATDVKLSAQFEKVPVQMTKDARGSWSVTVGPVKPDIYPYNFIVDGIQVMDPGNMALFPE